MRTILNVFSFDTKHSNLFTTVYFFQGLIYFDVPIAEDDAVIVPPLEGFVMNRTLGDYFETLLYKVNELRFL